ncbi:MAG: hypothetical protein A2408_04250 [Candidatus Yonathbacteria bacterium RIFOXYC1_FULL_52_10]|uniref:Uncharacterized protein n=1 Tax=Candidatus Yonathbacteria bacterium RIFOXYD1_FULL_52_36 TaxID=1802730 RepID=A0A1G2SPC3_9BACT|nr:MAG: hypothetical protein A2408_04250 [Candidatus Yonathbacteria bacterium RIFOXYC1_FULL_52_10]OHA86231.1 MAG: hypothetical protein A2591_00425 [Candidatus Yonathbacteria bacterium RIFOXYD1_FULL_52_36]
MMNYVQYVVAVCALGLLQVQAVAVSDQNAWYSFVYEKPRLTSTAFFVDLEGEQNHVSPEGFLRQLNEHGGYAFHSVEAAASYFATSSTISIRPCTWDTTGIPPGGGIMRTNAHGTEFDVWRREGRALCEDGERFVYDGDTPKFSLYCGNVIVSPVDTVRTKSVFVPETTCVKRITSSYRSSYVDIAPGFYHGGIGVGAARSGALIENECDSVLYESYQEGE